MSHSADAHRTMPGSHLVIFDDVGHFPHCEDPERFVEALEEFISSTPPAHVSEAQWRGLLRSSQEVETAFGGDIARHPSGHVRRTYPSREARFTLDGVRRASISASAREKPESFRMSREMELSALLLRVVNTAPDLESIL